MAVGNKPASGVPLAWELEYLAEGDREKIEQAVKSAEQKTKGDIVPMVVHRSANVSSVAPTLFLLLFAVILLIGTKPLVEEREIPFLIFALETAVTSLILAFVLGRMAWIQRLVIPAAVAAHEVHLRAELEFYRNHFDQTKSHGAVLIFVSLFERRVVVLCDEFLAKKIPQVKWDSVAKLVTQQMRHHRLQEGLSKAIELSGELLAEVLPADSQDKSQTHEISTDFRVKE